MISLVSWFVLGLLTAAFAAFIAAHYYRPTLRQQAFCWIGAYLLIFIGLALVPDTARLGMLKTFAWPFSSRTELHDTMWPLGLCYLAFGMSVAYFVPRYMRIGLGDGAGTLRHVAFPFRAASLTFDDGPSPEWTPKILDVLDRHQIKATFFMVGTAVEQFPDLVREIARRGHSIGNHSWSHRPMPLLDPRTLADEIDRAAEAIERATGKRPRYFRPPWGFYTRRVLDELRARGYLTVLWSVSSHDWRNPGVDEIEKRAAGQPAMGDIVLFHDGGNYPSPTLPTTPREQTVEALDRTIVRFERHGFELKSLDEMVSAWVS